jgi:uncharacterized membrane protein
MDPLGRFHLATAVVAMVSGAIVALLPKGRTTHRRVGWIYVSAMLALNASALLIYDLFGRFGPFHFAAIVSLVTIAGGLTPALRRKPKRRWIRMHAFAMSWSYVGLLAAAASEISTRYLNISFWGLVLTATLVVVAVSGFVVQTRVPAALVRFEPRAAGHDPRVASGN